jgi:basic amino acid/polyamine antiporter, APA family
MSSAQKLDLVRGLGPWSSAAIVVGTMIGTGIFLKPSEMAADAGSLSIVLAAWIAGGLLSLFGALAFAELGAALPEAGGEYAYLRRAFGPVWGFLFGWMHSIVGRPASMSSIASGLLRFCVFLVPALGAPLFTVHISVPFSPAPYEFAFTWAQPGAVSAIGAMALINFLGVRAGGRVQVALTAIKIGAVIAIIFVGLVLVHPRGAGFHPLLPSGSGAAILTGFFGALAASLWAYDGWEDLNLVGSEVENPQHNIPRALIAGVLFCAALFILFSLAAHSALSFGVVAQSGSVGSDVVARVVGPAGTLWVTLAMVISAAGTLNSSVLAGARVPYAMARDGLFFRATAEVHPRFRTPGGALLFEFVLASLFALTGTFEELTSLFLFATWIFYALAVAAMIRLRHSEPELVRPYRCFGYPWVPAAFLAGAAALTVTLWLARPVRSSIGLVLIFSGLIFYRLWQRKLAAQVVIRSNHTQ